MSLKILCEGTKNSLKGHRFAHFLTYFSGKDLLIAMADDLKAYLNIESAKSAINNIILSLLEKQAQTNDIWKWLPEWEALRNEIINYQNG